MIRPNVFTRLFSRHEAETHRAQKTYMDARRISNTHPRLDRGDASKKPAAEQNRKENVEGWQSCPSNTYAAIRRRLDPLWP